MVAMTQLTIGQLAARSGVAASALRFYESRGLIAAVRTTGNQRRYESSTLRRVACISAAQVVGLSLEEIGEALDNLPAGRVPNRADWSRLSARWRSRLEEQIARIERLRDRLDSCIGCGCLSLKSCAFSNPGDVYAERGAGARLLPDTLRRPHPTRRSSD